LVDAQVALQGPAMDNSMAHLSESVQMRLEDLEREVLRACNGCEGLRASISMVESQLHACAIEWSSESHSLRERLDAFQADAAEARVGVASIVGAFSYAYAARASGEPD